MRTKDKGVLLYLSSEELKSLDDKVKKTNCSRSDYIRKALNNIEIKEAPHPDYYKLIREVRRVGNNLNQLLALANSKGLIISGELRSVIEEYRKVLAMLWDTFSVGDS